MTSLLRELTPAPIPLSVSTTITSRPARASARATARPMTPAPTTRHSPDSIPQLSAPSGAFPALILQPVQARPRKRSGEEAAVVAPVQLNRKCAQAASCGISLAPGAKPWVCLQIAPDRPSVAGTLADKQFDSAASDTSKTNFKGVHQTGSTPFEESVRNPGCLSLEPARPPNGDCETLLGEARRPGFDRCRGRRLQARR